MYADERLLYHLYTSHACFRKSLSSSNVSGAVFGLSLEFRFSSVSKRYLFETRRCHTDAISMDCSVTHLKTHVKINVSLLWVDVYLPTSVCGLHGVHLATFSLVPRNTCFLARLPCQVFS